MARWAAAALVGKQAGLHSVPGFVPGLDSARLRTTNIGPRGQTRRSVSIGEKKYTSLRCKLKRFVSKFLFIIRCVLLFSLKICYTIF